MTTPLLAALFDFSFSPHMIAIIVPVAGMIFGGVMAVSAMYFKHQKQRLWHETARVALERGQPLPANLVEDDKPLRLRVRSGRNDVRSGLILISVGAGLYLFLWQTGARDAAAVGAIPGFIGVALLLFGLLSSPAPKDPSAPGDRPGQP